MAQQSIYEKYGGFARINRVVLAFYDACLDSDDIGPFFDDVDMPRLIDHQTKFISSLLGGPASFEPGHIEHAHRNLRISSGHFDKIKILFADVLRQQDFSDPDIEAVLAAIEIHRARIVTTTDVD